MGFNDLEMVEVDFVLVSVRPSPLSVSLSLLGEVIDLSTGAGATVDTILSSLVLVFFGGPMKVQDPGKRRAGLVREIVEFVGSQASVLHGSRQWAVGNYGGSDRFNYGPVGPEIPVFVRRVLEMELGEVVEV